MEQQEYDSFSDAISPAEELAAYEALWLRAGASATSISTQHRADPNRLFTEQANQGEIEKSLDTLQTRYPDGFPFHYFSVFDRAYPQTLYDATLTIPMLYTMGHWDLLSSPAVAIVGTRNPTPMGERITRQLVRDLVADNYTVTAGLATGIEAIAHETAMMCGGRTMAVIGTAIDQCYRKHNQTLQTQIINEHLLVSQVPVLIGRESNEGRYQEFMAIRNSAITALSQAVVMIDAKEGAASIKQAQEALKQGRQVFILAHNFDDPDLIWPRRLEKKGAIRVDNYQQICQRMANATIATQCEVVS